MRVRCNWGWNRAIRLRQLGIHKIVIGFSFGIVTAVAVAFVPSRIGGSGSLIANSGLTIYIVPHALAAACKGATVVCAGIHMRDIPGFPYSLLWGERAVRSVANLTRADGEAFFSIAEQVDIKTVPVIFPLQNANDALDALRGGRFDGAAVLVPDRNG